ncbi:MAG: hypothetical protein L0J60_03005, partial [Psychroflexus sp.]|nr:hypothetical protein [Psychroflexus sp.]
MSKENTYRNQTGFNLPETYLDNFKVDPLKLVKDESSFKTPDGYFENFKVDLPRKKSKVRQLKSSYSAASAIAALLVVAFMISHFVQNKMEKEDVKFSSIEQQELEEYIENEIENPLDYIDQNLEFDFKSDFENSQIGSEKIIYYL